MHVILFSSIQFIHLTAIPYFLHDLVECKSYPIQSKTQNREFHLNRKIQILQHFYSSNAPVEGKTE